MLAYILAIAIALASLSLYLSAFFLPELHRKDDFLWSGVGLLYALILWVCAERVTGGVLLGQAAAVSLMLSFGWQTVRLRRAIAHPDEQTDLGGFSLLTWVQNRFKKKSSPQPIPSPVIETTEEAVIPPEETTAMEPLEVTAEITLQATPEVTEEITIEETETPETEVRSEPQMTETETEAEPLSTVPPQPETKKRGFSFKSWFGLGKSQSQPTAKPSPTQEEATDLEEDDENWENEAEIVTTVVETIKEETEIEVEEKNWDDDEEDASEVEATVSPVTEEIEVIVPETVTEIPEEPQIVSETVLEETKEKPEALEEYVAEFEPFLVDDEAETVIESYQPKLDKVAKETVKIEAENPPEPPDFPVTSSETEDTK